MLTNAKRCGSVWKPMMVFTVQKDKRMGMPEMTHTVTLTIEDAQTRDPALSVTSRGFVVP